MIHCLCKHLGAQFRQQNPVTIVDDISEIHRWTGTLPIGPPRSTSGKMVLFVPRPWYLRCCWHSWHGTPWHALLSWPCKMSLLQKKPHGGPITHSSTGSKPDSPVHPQFPKLFLALDFLCNLRAPCQVIYSGIRRNTYSRCSEPLHLLIGIERLPIGLKLLMVPSYFALDIFLSFNSRGTYAPSPGLTVWCSILLESVLIGFSLLTLL